MRGRPSNRLPTDVPLYVRRLTTEIDRVEPDGPFIRRGQTVRIIASLLASIMKAKIVVKTALHKIAQNPKAGLGSLSPSIIVDYGVLDYVQ
jgi:hypothetical protein